MTRKIKILVVVIAVAAVASAAAMVLLARCGSTHESLAFRVDPSVRPSVAQVAAVEGSTGLRPVGALARPDGTVAEIVLDEVIVHVKDGAELAAFLGRWNGQVLDSFPPDTDGQDHLVRVDTSRADPSALPRDLLAVEPEQTGEHRVSDERVVRLLALAAAEWRRGTEVVVDWLTEPTSIETGEAYEASDITEGGKRKNVFDWSFMRSGGAMDIGVGAAWQLLRAHGKLEPQIKYMILDGGFTRSPDLPESSKIRKAEWGDKNPKDCTNGHSCPYHGTDVALAAMATVDNEYGTAGPAGPVVSQFVAVGNSLDYWSIMRRLEKIAEEEKPDVVNLSFSRDVNVGRGYAKTWTDRRMQHVRRTGALIVAAAGNDGRSVDRDTLVVPCESTYVMCVGGMASNATVAGRSNFGEGDSRTSVEIYGPMCVRTVNDPNKSHLDFTTKETCGTSVASPFVGGVAALVMAADPSLGAEQVRKILNDTAHVGGLGSKVTGSQRRINALQAVAQALGVTIADPKVTIQAPADGKQLRPDNWIDLRGTATDFMGRTLKISWASDRQGKLVEGSNTGIPKLDLGTHKLTATATDNTGRTGTATVTVHVVDTPPEVKIVSPPAGLKVIEGTVVPLVGTSLDSDNWSPVPDEDTAWEVRRGTTVVHTAAGHSATLPATKATPGTYTVKFTAGRVTAQTTFTVTAVPQGQTKPIATITKPTQDVALDAYNGTPQGIAFAGTGTDKEDGAIAGTRYRWTAYAGGEKKVLCTGSNVPTGAPPGGLATYKSCASFTGELGLSGGAAVTTWTVILEVFDSTGLIAMDFVNVKIRYITG